MMELNFSSLALAGLERLHAAGYDAWLVGGCVRDGLLGRRIGDYDIATSALPEQTKAVFFRERVIETGLKHGTVTVLLEGLPLEITTFRRETTYSDHRHPDGVVFGRSVAEDLARRDFTVNAMAWQPSNGLLDFFGGQEDLEQKRIRCVGEPEARFTEDALRILRALRFSSVLGFTLHPDTAAAALDKRQLLEYVSRERIASELCKLLCGRDVARVVTEYWPILAVPIPEIGAMAGFDQHSRYHCYDVLTHSAVAASEVAPEPVLRLAALLHDVGKPATFFLDEKGNGHCYGHAKVGAALCEKVLTDLRLDRETVRRVTTLVELHDYPIDPPPESNPKTVKRLLGRLGEEDFFRLLAIKRADALAHHPDYRDRAHACDALETVARQVLSQAQCFSLKDLAVHGKDLQGIGIAPGPEMGRILRELLDAVISDRAQNDRDALLSLAGRIARSTTTKEDPAKT